MEVIAGLPDPVPEIANPLAMDGIEYVEYATAAPQALGQVLETMGFRPVARHRSREVLLYRQGELNVVVNAHPGVVRAARRGGEDPCISAVALRVRDARAAYDHAVANGAWDVPVHAQVMELNIPGIHGPGGAHFYFVDRWREFSIYDVDFVPIPGVDRHPPSTAGIGFFGVVQYVGRDRTDDWVAFYRRLLGFRRLPDDERYGILPAGTLLRSPCNRFCVQLVEPHTSTLVYDESEQFNRIGLGVPDVPAAVAALRRNGVDFYEVPQLHTEPRGALTRTYLRSVSFELVHDKRSDSVSVS